MDKQRYQDKNYLPSFARTRSRGLKDQQKHLLREILPSYRPDIEAISTMDSIAFEIGFGKGEHLIHRATNEPKTHFIGCEVYDEGMASCLSKVVSEKISNISLWQDDARLLIEQLPDHCLDTIYILFPDPWPKTKHHKRRIVNQALLDLLKRVIKPNGMLQIATDHPDYARWVMTQTAHNNDFVWQANHKKDWLDAPEGHLDTRYQAKNKAGSKHPFFLNFKRI